RMEVICREEEQLLVVRRWSEEDCVLVIGHFGTRAVRRSVPFGAGRWRKLLDSADATWQGPGGAAPEEAGGAGGGPPAARARGGCGGGCSRRGGRSVCLSAVGALAVLDLRDALLDRQVGPALRCVVEVLHP